MKIGIVLDNKVNKWAIQRFEPLKDKYDITVFVGERNDFDVSFIDLNIKRLTRYEETSLALKDPLTAYKRILKAPYKKMDYYYFSLKKHLKGIDVVYTCDVSRSAYTLASLKDELGFKLLLSWWENIPYRAVLDEKTSLHKRYIMDKVDLFLPFTNMAKKVLKLEGVPEEKLEVLYPGVDLGRFKPGKKPEQLLAGNDILANSFVVLYVGKLVSWKGVHNLVYAARILKQRGIEDFVMAVAGKGAQRENMEKLIDESGTRKNFRFLNFVSYEEMPEIYRLSDVLVLPSYPTMAWQEQFGMVLIEAMASGKPVISSNSGSIPEVVGGSGLLVPSGDYFRLAEAIYRLKNDKELNERLCKESRERAEMLYDAEANSLCFRNIVEDRI